MPRTTGEAGDQQRLVDYLLGSLPEEASERLDELSVTDTAFADALAAAEHDLTDAYIHGELTGETLERFRSHYLASAFRREKVDLATVLRKLAASQPFAKHGLRDAKRPGVSRTTLRWVLAVAASALVALGGWLASENARLRDQVRAMEARGNAGELQRQLEAERAAAADSDRELGRLRDARERLEKELQGIAIVSFVLTPPRRSVQGPAVVRIPAGTSHVAVQLELEPDDYDAYRISLLGSSSQIIWTSELRSARKTPYGEALDVSLRAGQLPPGKYILRVTGVSLRGTGEVVADYPFSVVGG